MRYQDFYQLSLILFAFLIVFGVAVFTYKEIFPQYKIYQDAYVNLEDFRSTYTGEEPAPFKKGIKQIILSNDNGGQQVIDRCTSCHVAMDLPHFSKTRIALDINDHPIIDEQGNPVLTANPDYVWGRLEERITELRNSSLIEELRAQGKGKEADTRLVEAERLVNLKESTVDGKKVDVEKVIAMHPLIGGEMHPFEYHPMSEYGCTSCHSGNGRALVASRAHGPVFDGEYEKAYAFSKPQFTEIDEENDPLFAKMYNDKPSHDLIFQTTPLLAGPLIDAKCVSCHQPASSEVKTAIDKINFFEKKKKREIDALESGMEDDREALEASLTLLNHLEKDGYDATLVWINQKLSDGTLSSDEIDAFEGRLTFLKQSRESGDVQVAIVQEIKRILGSEELAEQFMKEGVASKQTREFVNAFLNKLQEGVFFDKKAHNQQALSVLNRVQESKAPFVSTVQNPTVISEMQTDVDRLIVNYNRGKELFISQSCYACHRINGFSRSSVGPELTKIGLSYPWFVKESIVWPQADLPSSTMPNFRLDHEELGDLMAFLMAQTGDRKAISEVDYQISVSAWDAGEKMPWEKPVPPTDLRDVRAGMRVFATEGCASCHKLEGFESDVGFAVENDPEATLQQNIDVKEWFYQMFPEELEGSQIAARVRKYANDIDQKIVPDVRSDSTLEQMEKQYPGLIEGYYSNFKFAGRTRNSELKENPDAFEEYRERLHRVLMVYIQLYGLGRDIAPHLNWSGIYRSDEWLLGHFRNPGAYTAKSIMPVMPFDDTKFFALNYMLHVLGRKNRDEIRDIWRVQGFHPPRAFELLCSSCHGESRLGNGIISEWIYPIPKNLRNPVFLRSLTKEQAINSIMHGVKGTPMAPWGEVGSPLSVGDPIPVLTRSEIIQLVEWLYQSLPQEKREVTKEDFEKWEYTPKDVIQEMEKEHNMLSPAPPKWEDVGKVVDDYFEVRPNPIPGSDKELFYIREKFYTPENLKEAQSFFAVNCSTCHGKEGTGTGLRASSMLEAKPRMFTNLPWIRSRDDLRLLRSIKYGVPGTAMIPWGDQTSAKMRMQLTLFIRDLTRYQVFGEELEDVLYEAFDQNALKVDEARIEEYSEFESTKQQYQNIQDLLYHLTEVTLAPAAEVTKTYSESYALKQRYERGLKQNALYQELITLIEEERGIFHGLGGQLISKKAPENVLESYFNLIKNIPYQFSMKSGQLTFEYENELKTKSAFYLIVILNYLDDKIGTFQKQIDIEESKILNPERGKIIQDLMSQQGEYINLKTKINMQLVGSDKIHQKQMEIYREIQSLRKSA